MTEGQQTWIANDLLVSEDWLQMSTNNTNKDQRKSAATFQLMLCALFSEKWGENDFGKE